MRPFSMFARRSEPSAEALAGTGPSKTYPAPPSAGATPEAIASVAGGTAQPKTNLGGSSPSQFASGAPKTPSFGAGDVSSGFATPASVNMSAAQANGFPGAPQTASYANTGTPKATTSGYQFGKKSFTPKTPESVATTTPSISTPSTSLPAGQQAPSSYATTSSAFAPPSVAASGNTSVGTSANTSTSAGPASGGFTLPSDFSNSVSKAATSATDAIGSWAPPALGAPVAASTPAVPSTTSVAETKTAAAISSTSETPASSSLPASGSGYMPGSTGGSSAYPASKYPTSTSGSFYR
ncbi:hypothetical protein SH528x_006037 [Novipirellula sp. SH528]|uniref:hypothetical protein n=1 Tax=Novipirellula sp. SH528 TaxID=3454466 RepID=UPI003FA0512C